MIDLHVYLTAQAVWSAKTFGLGLRTVGITEHIKKELDEIRANPTDLEEWIDVMILAMDGYWRAGGLPEELMERLMVKQIVNLKRQWPAPQPEHMATEHIR